MPRRGMPSARRLWGSRLLVVTGKGGVGKSTLTAALGHAMAARGRRVLLLETDPREHLHRLLGTAPSGGERVPAGERLAHLNLRPRLVIEDLVRERVPVPLLARAVLASPIFDHFVEGAPGLKEMAILGYAYRATEEAGGEHAVDVVVLDAPATGHGASMLAAPLLVAEVLPRGPIAELAGKLADFMADPARCAVVVATQAEEMPVQEALELIELLRARVGRPPELVAVNALYPPLPKTPPGSTANGGLELWRRRRELNQRELARLAATWTGLRVDLPLLPIDGGPELVAEIAARIEAALGHPEERA